jgi:DNA polymerase-3 subunit gamma/tau
MVLVRIAYAADLPTPDEAIRMIDQNGGASPSLGSNGSGASSRAPAPTQSFDQTPPPRAMAPSPSRSGYDTTARAPVVQPAADPSPAQPQLRIGTYAELIALAAEKRDLQVKSALEADLRLVRMEEGRLEVALESHASRSVVNDLQRKLEFWTGRRWVVAVSNEAGQPTLRAQALAKKEQLTVGIHADPRIQAVMARFPGTQVIDVRNLAPEPPDDAVVDDSLEPDDNDDL